jgi:hypothetical protein
MWKRYLFVVLGLALTSPTYSNSVPLLSATPIAQTGDNAELDEQMINRELQLFRQSQISLCQALVMAEKLHPGSRTWDIGFDGSSSSPIYRVKTARTDQIWENTIDTRTGEVVGAEVVSVVKDLDAEDRNNVIALGTVKQGLLDAVLIAERAAGGKAIGGAIIKERGTYNFVVVVVSGDDLKQVILEAPKARRSDTSPRHAAAIGQCA